MAKLADMAKQLSQPGAGQLLTALAKAPVRSLELERRVPGLDRKALFTLLADLVTGGLVDRRQDGDSPLTAVCELSASGRDAVQLLSLWEKTGQSAGNIGKVVGVSWMQEILSAAADGWRSVADFQGISPGLRKAVLQERLKTLEEVDLLHRQAINTKPVTIHYVLAVEVADIRPLLDRLVTLRGL